MPDTSATLPPVDAHPDAPLIALVEGITAAYHRRSMDVRTQLEVSANEWSVLAHLVSAGSLTAGELARRSGLAGPTITSLVDRLERAELLERRSDEVDRRKRFVTPTHRSRHAVLSVSHELASHLRRALDDLSDKDCIEDVFRFARAAAERLSRP